MPDDTPSPEPVVPMTFDAWLATMPADERDVPSRRDAWAAGARGMLRPIRRAGGTEKEGG